MYGWNRYIFCVFANSSQYLNTGHALGHVDSLHSLSRRDIRCDSVLCSLFGINDVECRAFFWLGLKGNASLDDIAAYLHKDKSTTHRCMEKLVSLGLCFKDSQSLEAGGHRNVYTAASPKKVQEDAMKVLDDFYSAMKEKVLFLDEYIRAELRNLP